MTDEALEARLFPPPAVGGWFGKIGPDSPASRKADEIWRSVPVQ